MVVPQSIVSDLTAALPLPWLYDRIEQLFGLGRAGAFDIGGARTHPHSFESRRLEVVCPVGTLL
jgi:hypothetical protein